MVAALHGSPTQNDRTAAHMVFQSILGRYMSETKTVLQGWGRRDSPVRRVISEITSKVQDDLLAATLDDMATGESGGNSAVT